MEAPPHKGIDSPLHSLYAVDTDFKADKKHTRQTNSRKKSRPRGADAFAICLGPTTTKQRPNKQHQPARPHTHASILTTAAGHTKRCQQKPPMAKKHPVCTNHPFPPPTAQHFKTTRGEPRYGRRRRRRCGGGAAPTYPSARPPRPQGRLPGGPSLPPPPPCLARRRLTAPAMPPFLRRPRRYCCGCAYARCPLLVVYSKRSRRRWGCRFCCLHRRFPTSRPPRRLTLSPPPPLSGMRSACARRTTRPVAC